MKDVIKNRLVILILALIPFSCNSDLEEEISWQLDDFPDLLVVEGIVTNRFERQFMFLSVTGEYLSTEPPAAVSDAQVSVSDGLNTFTYSESDSIDGFYISDSAFNGVPLKTYTLQVSLTKPLNGISEFRASSTMPEGLQLDSIVCEIYAMPDLGFGYDDENADTTLLGIYYYGKEPVNPDNYYVAKVYSNNVPWQVNARDLIRFTDDYNNGGRSDFILFIKNVSSGDTIGFELNSVERKYYDYIGSIQLMDQSGSAYSMSGPPANAVGNIPNALGYFLATSISRNTGIAVDMRN